MAKRPLPQANVVPDKLDLRDRPYLPAVAVAPPPALKSRVALPVLDQGDTSACTGFALASVVGFLLRRASGSKQRRARAPQVSPFMLYSMARRYDEFPGYEADGGSSLRGAMKGWYKHGACEGALWRRLEMPKPAARPEDDWWFDAARRPLGAYYRVDTRSVTDMHVALDEVGILYASAVCHGGWLDGFDHGRKRGTFAIPHLRATARDGGHAFAIVGYTEHGFVVQNSWGRNWGSAGLGILSYADWTENAMDCWVAQLGVVTDLHLEIARSRSLRVDSTGRVRLATDTILRNREIAPFVIDMENNGRLSDSGDFRTQEGDVKDLVTRQAGEARRRFGLGPAEPMDVAIYAHGGLTDEDTAARTAARWIPALYGAQIFPIFFMWETGLWKTLENRLADLVRGRRDVPVAGPRRDQLERFWNRRVERLLAPAGSLVWDEMKQNADAISADDRSGGILLYRVASASPWFARAKVRLHLVGHSAGAILHSHAVARLAARGWKFESVNFLAPAARVDTFHDLVEPRIRDGAVKHFRTFHLTDATEQQDTTVRPLLGYGRSLLYLVSESFEHGARTPILGLERYFDEHVARRRLRGVEGWAAPSGASASTTHGGFDDDEATLASVIALIKRGALAGR